jgi:hypothetical protein
MMVDGRRKMPASPAGGVHVPQTGCASGAEDGWFVVLALYQLFIFVE